VNITLFTPYDKQKDIIDRFADSEHKFGIAACARQVGKSLLGQNLMLYWLLKDAGSKGAIISPIYAQSRKIFKELSEAGKAIIDEKNRAELTIKFINGSTLIFLGAERHDSIRGFSFNYLFIDEAAYIKEEAINSAILPTLTSIGKKAFIASTPKSKNWFYNYYINGLDETKDDYISFQWTSFESPYVDDAFLREQERSLPDAIFRQEYFAHFSDAGQDVFKGLDDICILNEFQSANKAERCFVGVDVGLSADYTVLTVMSESGRILTMDRFNGVTVTEAAERIIRTLNKFNIVGGYVEINNIGKAIYEHIKPKFRKIQPFTTSQDSKLTIVRQLLEDIETKSVEFPSEKLFPWLYRELGFYSYKLSSNGKMSFGHPSGQNDDTCDSVMFANHARHSIQTKAIYIGAKQDVNVGFGLPR